MCRQWLCLVLVLGFAGLVTGAPLTIANFSFEEPYLDGETLPFVYKGTIEGWREGSQNGRQGIAWEGATVDDWNTFHKKANVPGPIHQASHGEQYAFLQSYNTQNPANAIWQYLGDTYQVGSYILTLDTANLDQLGGGKTCHFELFAGDEVTTRTTVATGSHFMPEVSDFNEVSLTVEIEAGSPLIGQPIGIHIRNETASNMTAAGMLLVDNVRLETPRQDASRPTPVDGAVVYSTAPTLGWQPGDFSTQHRLLMDIDADAVANGSAQVNIVIEANSFDVGVADGPYPDGLVPGTTLYWRVDAINQDNTDESWPSPIWSFVVPPVTTWNPVPADGFRLADPNVILVWDAPLNADLYTVYFSDNQDDVVNGVGGVEVNDPRFDPTEDPNRGLPLNTNHYWRVDSSDGTTTHAGALWTFRTKSDIPITDPNLKAWYKFDDGAGMGAIDSSGHNNDGELFNGPQWTAGLDGGALFFDGDLARIDAPRSVQDDFTLSAWIQADSPGLGDEDAYGASYYGWGGSGLIYAGNSIGGTSDDFSLAVFNTRLSLGVGNPRTSVTSENDVVTGEWVHVAGVRDVGAGTIRVYIDGALEGSLGHPNTSPLNKNPLITIAANTFSARFYKGLIDEVRLYDKVLSDTELQELNRIDPLQAWQPSPGSGASFEITAPPAAMGWKAGDSAAAHQVYLGTDKHAVATADATDTTGIYRGSQADATYPLADLAMGQRYYWRIDETNTDGSVTTGRLWNFRIRDSIGVDNFETYDLSAQEGDPGDFYGVWMINLDSGAFRYLDTEQAHSGTQSLRLEYDNDGEIFDQGEAFEVGLFSEVTGTFVSAQDWTLYDVGALNLAIRGSEPADPNVSSDPLYVTVSDGTNTVKVVHDDPEILRSTAWQTWSISFDSLAGLDLKNIQSLTVGTGDSAATEPGTQGILHVDDIKLGPFTPAAAIE